MSRDAPTYPSRAQRRGLGVLLDAVGRVRSRAGCLWSATAWAHGAQFVRSGGDIIEPSVVQYPAVASCLRTLAAAYRSTRDAATHDALGRAAYDRVRALYTSHDPAAWPAVEQAFAAAVRGKNAARRMTLAEACVVATLRSALVYYGHDPERVVAAGVMDLARARAAVRGDDPEAAFRALMALSLPDLDGILRDVARLGEVTVRRGFGEDAPGDWWPHTVARFGQENAEAALRVAATSVIHRLGRR